MPAPRARSSRTCWLPTRRRASAPFSKNATRNGEESRDLAPILDLPAALLGEATQAAMRVHGHGLVCPFEGRPIRNMVGIETNVPMNAFEARRLHPIRDHPHFRRSVAILAGDSGVHALIEADDRSGADYVVEAETFRDCVGVEPIGSCREHEAAALRFVTRYCL